VSSRRLHLESTEGAGEDGEGNEPDSQCHLRSALPEHGLPGPVTVGFGAEPTTVHQHDPEQQEDHGQAKENNDNRCGTQIISNRVFSITSGCRFSQVFGPRCRRRAEMARSRSRPDAIQLVRDGSPVLD
jgi:hypothetical protein